MKILVIGLGSMGKRRIRLLQEIDQDFKILAVDYKHTRRKEAEKIFGIETIVQLEDVTENQKKEITCAFVCTSPLSHNSLIRTCLENDWHVFTELNLISDGYEENINLARKKGKILFISSTFLYREEMLYIKAHTKGVHHLNYIYHVGQYLPDWHPWESYKNFFVSDKRTNGCREIMALEFPWLIDVFGEIKEVSVCSDNMSQLSLDYKDNYMIQLTHENENKGMLMVDVVCPYAVRNLEVYGENLYIRWNGTPESLQSYDIATRRMMKTNVYKRVEKLQGYSNTIVENAYKNEIIEFFKILKDGKKQQYSFEKDLEILRLLDKIEG